MAEEEVGARYRKSSAHIRSLLKVLLDDPILSDVPKDGATLAHVDALISVELGNAMSLSIVKMDGSTFDVPVPNAATVRELKAAVREHIDKEHRHISWKHVWSNFCLCYENTTLLEEGAILRDLGIRNNDQIRFQSYVRLKEAGRHSHARRKHI